MSTLPVITSCSLSMHKQNNLADILFNNHAFLHCSTTTKRKNRQGVILMIMKNTLDLFLIPPSHSHVIPLHRCMRVLPHSRLLPRSNAVSSGPFLLQKYTILRAIYITNQTSSSLSSPRSSPSSSSTTA